MEELVTLTTKEPSMDIEERWRYKYPNVACELLTCDVPTLNEKLAGICKSFIIRFIIVQFLDSVTVTQQLYIVFSKLPGDEILLAKLYSFIDTDQPLNPLLASFFSKTLGVLVARKSDQVIIHKFYFHVVYILMDSDWEGGGNICTMIMCTLHN